MKAFPLEDRSGRADYNYAVDIDFTDLNDTAGLTKTLNIWPQAGTFAAGHEVQAAALKIQTNFDGGATSSLTVQIGDGDDPNRFLAATEIHEDGTELKYASGTGTRHSYTGADTIDALFTAVGANLDALTAGKVTLLLKVVNLDALAGSRT